MYEEVGNAKDKYAISILRGPDVRSSVLTSKDL